MIKRSALWLSMAIACGFLLPEKIYAQEGEGAADQTDEQSSEDAVGQSTDEDEGTEDSADLERLAVTGSLLQRTNADTLEPSVIIDAELLRNRGINNIATILNETAAFGAPAATPQGGQNGFSVGQSFVNFLGLGSQRTLTVVNGRRFVSSNAPTIFGEDGGLQVDFNALPVALVDSIETIGIGGAPTYGTDALAGTINVKYKRDFEGLELGVQYGLYDIGGDPENVSVSGAWGANFSDRRGNVAIAVEYNQQDGLDNFARPLFVFDDPVFRAEDGINRIFFDRDINILSFDGNISPGGLFIPALGLGSINDEFYRFNSEGNIITCDPGTVDPESIVSSVELVPTPNESGGTCGDDFFERVGQRQSPLKRLTFTGIGHYDITDNVTAFVEFNAFSSEAEELANQAAFNTAIFGDDSGPLTFSADHPLLNAQARQTLADLGLDTFGLNRSNQDLLNDGPDFSENDTLRIVAGLEGGFTALDRFFNWEVYANFGQSDISSSGSDIIDQRFFNALDATAITQDILDAFDDPLNDLLGISAVRNGQTVVATLSDPLQVGDVVCQAELDVANGTLQPASGSGVVDGEFPFVTGCVPLSLFGNNTSTPEAIAFIQGQQVFRSELEQEVIQGTIATDLFELPAGPVGLGLGFQHREESGTFDAGGFAELGLGRSAPILDTAGQFNTEEFFGEVYIPVLDESMNIPLINTLSIEGKGRIVDNSLAGSDTTYTVGGRFTTVGDFRFAGNFTQSIRAPSIVELFAPISQSFQTADDPCDSDFINDEVLDANGDPILVNGVGLREANCVAAGVPFDADGNPGFTSNIADATALGTNGGNPNLRNEIARSWTVGLAWVPSYLRGLIFSVDYINVSIDDRIESLDVEDNLVACFDSTDFPNVPFCNNFTRDENFQVVDFTSGTDNAATSELQAVLFDVRYDTTISDLFNLSDDYGSVNWRVNGIRRIQNDLSITGIDQDEVVGGFNNPEWSLTFDTNYSLGRLGFFWRTIWQSRILLDPNGDEEFEFEGQPITDVGDRWLHNASVFYEVLDGVTARFTVNNIANRRGSLLDRASGNITTLSEILGRQYLFNLRMTF